MNFFNKETSTAAMCIIKAFLEHGVQPTMYHLLDDCEVELAYVSSSHEYDPTWMFVASCKCKKSCSFWELNDLVSDYGLAIQLKPGEQPKLVPADIVSLCA